MMPSWLVAVARELTWRRPTTKKINKDLEDISENTQVVVTSIHPSIPSIVVGAVVVVVLVVVVVEVVGGGSNDDNLFPRLHLCL